ncbi:TIGR01777 family protein [Ornithinibacillus sp. L9]|uniref:TIGR01777 family protein n=1 Tax=Ornithinibacillus caprae TaxID=2678566 RepID=A0A6N8FFI9_9BACI|nr:TIGR01777 family oxidoreductase [Ornithinibacillus caprae]MUK88330.1 TIGR01777 family protein [Ornithinibacillus caprae]
MNFLITGGTGFVGKHLVDALHQKNHHTYILTRSPDTNSNSTLTSYIGYDHPIEQLPAIHGVVNLAGESLFGYWTKHKKEKILSSRIETTEKVINIMKQLDKKPEVFINGSAVGYYGMSEDLMFTEATEEPGDDFLAHVVVEWEKTAKQAENLGIRTVFARFGVILGKEGALPLMSLPVKLFAGGRVGSGEQWLSWIHVDDVVELLMFCLTNPTIQGPVNFTAPNPMRNKEFTKILANVLKRPYWLPTPGPLFRLATGQMSKLVLKGQYVLPRKAQEHNYTFIFPELEHALRNLYQSA